MNGLSVTYSSLDVSFSGFDIGRMFGNLYGVFCINGPGIMLVILGYMCILCSIGGILGVVGCVMGYILENC